MPTLLERKDSAITYQELRAAIELEHNARLLAEKKILEYQTKVDKAIALCQRYNHSGCNLDSHRLAKSVLDLLESK